MTFHLAISFIAFLAATPVLAGAAVAEISPGLQTEALGKANGNADADDPAIWVHPAKPEKTLIVTAVKNGGMRVYGLDGGLRQALDPMEKGARINNVDLVYGFRMEDGSLADLAVASDRGLDKVRIFRIDGDKQTALEEVSDPAAGRVFPTRPDETGSGRRDNPIDAQNTAYGLAAYRESASGKAYLAVTQRHQPVLALMRLSARPGGKVAAETVREIAVPVTHKGQSLLQEDKDDPLKDWSPQFEGSVFDRRNGTLYAGQEDVGIWKIPLHEAGEAPQLFYETRGSSQSPFNNPRSRIARDVEGLTIYYGATKTYLIASSQGSAHGKHQSPDAPCDDSFVVFDLDAGPAPLGAFHVGAKGGIDAVQESDGADVLSTGLPGFENGLFVAQDGYAGDLDGLSGKTAATNFKFVDWREIAKAFTPPLEATPKAFDPRR